jgi:hypothetical protein
VEEPLLRPASALEPKQAQSPALAPTAATGEHLAACHFAEEIAGTGRMPGMAPEAASDRTLASRLQRLQQAFVHDTH